MQKHDPYAIFRIRNYQLFISGWLIALIGKSIQTTAIGWELYDRTGKPLALGLMGLATVLPNFALALPSGYLADRFSRRSVMTLSAVGTTATSLGLAVLSIGHGPVSWMYGLLICDATANVLGRPARSALLPQIIPREIFPNAVTWNSSLGQIGSVLGPALGGLVVALNVSASYFISAATTLIFIVVLWRIEIPRVEYHAGFSERMSLQELLAGLHFAWKTRLLLTIMSLDMFGVLLGGAVYLLPVFAKDILHIGPTGFGWLRAAPAAGAFCMAILLAHMPPMRRAGRNLLLAVAGFGIATIVFGLSKSFFLSLAMLFLTGIFDNVSVVVRQTLVQLLTPDHMRGRVTAVNFVFIGTSNELGGFESGVVAHWFGPVFAVVSGGFGTLLVVLITAIVSPPLRALGALHETRHTADKVSKGSTRVSG